MQRELKSDAVSKVNRPRGVITGSPGTPPLRIPARTSLAVPHPIIHSHRPKERSAGHPCARPALSPHFSGLTTPGPGTPLARSPGPRAPRPLAWPGRSRPAPAPLRGCGRRCAASSWCSSPPQSSSCRRREPKPAWNTASEHHTPHTWVTMRLLLGRFVKARLPRRSIGEGGNASALHWLLSMPIEAAGRAPPTHFRLCLGVGFPRSRHFLLWS